jgi:hypothetical protein
MRFSPNLWITSESGRLGPLYWFNSTPRYFGRTLICIRDEWRPIPQLTRASREP